MREEEPKLASSLQEQAPLLKEVETNASEVPTDQKESSFWSRVPTPGSADNAQLDKRQPAIGNLKDARARTDAGLKPVSADAQSGKPVKSGKPTMNLILFGSICFVLLLANLFFYLKSEAERTRQQREHPAPSTNQVVIGKGAPSGPVAVKINDYPELDGKSVAEIIAIRRTAVAEHKDLLPNYEPYTNCWKMQDGLPWWGVEGYQFYGRGPNSMAGPSWYGELVVNPFLLASLNLPPSEWSEQARSKAHGSSAFPYMCRPENLKWYPAERRTEVTYDLSKWANCASKVGGDQVSPEGMTFNLATFNGHDMGYNWTANVSEDGGKNPICYGGLNWQYLGAGQGAGVLCNNLFSSYCPVTIKKLPMKVTVKFWREKPSDFNNGADMIAVINLI